MKCFDSSFFQHHTLEFHPCGVGICSSFLFTAESYSILLMCHSLLTSSLAEPFPGAIHHGIRAKDHDGMRALEI